MLVLLVFSILQRREPVSQGNSKGAKQVSSCADSSSLRSSTGFLGAGAARRAAPAPKNPVEEHGEGKACRANLTQKKYIVEEHGEGKERDF